MTVIRPDWTSAQPPTPEKTGPETYAPPAQRMPEPPISDRDPHSIPLQQSEGVGQANTPVTEQLRFADPACRGRLDR